MRVSNFGTQSSVTAMIRVWTGVVTVGLWVVSGVGCSPAAERPAATSGSAATSSAPSDRSATRTSNEPASEIDTALAKLSEADRRSAEAQKICPVSDEPLGSMGTPIKFEVEGQTVWVCCEGCEQPVRDDPAQYLAKLKEN
jgi:hypothetical protein